MSFNNDLRLKAQAALKPYLGDDNSFQVKNPILLLNYLYQRAIIPSPRYCVIPTTQKYSQHAVSCEVGDLQFTGTGKTNKVAKASAAQQFLELLLKPVNISNVPSSLFDVSSRSFAAVPSNSVNGDSAHFSQNRVSFSSIKSRMEDSVLNEITESASLNHIVEPQMAQVETVHVGSQFNVFPECITQSTSESETVGKAPPNKFQIAPSPTVQELNCNLDVLSKDKRPKNLFLVREKPSCDDFFDPFFNQRPPYSNGTMTMEVKDCESHNQSVENESSHVDNEPNVVEDKNVFALLQKKTQKPLKLIPRFRTETIESGFRCNVQLGSYHASGEGRNKKIAKTKAAINLLNQINDVN